MYDDEVGARQPGQPLAHPLRREQPLPALRHRDDGQDHDRDREQEPPRARVGEHVGGLAEVDLPDEVRDGEAREERASRRPGAACFMRRRVADPLQRLEHVRDVVVGVRRRERQREDLVTRPLGDRQRRLVREALAVPREPVHGQEVDRGRDPLGGERLLQLVARQRRSARRRPGRRRGGARACRAGRARAARSRRARAIPSS